MAIKKELIQFTIINQTDCTFNIPLFQSNVYSINATTKYSWDITAADLSCGTGTIVINGITINLSFATNLAGLLSALNNLGYGFFCTETIGFSTFLYVVDDTNIYGDLDLCPSVVSTTTTTTTTTAAPTTTTTTTSTTTAAPTTTTTTTTSTTTAAPTTTTTTTTSTTTAAPTNSVVSFTMEQKDDGFGVFWAEANIILNQAVLVNTTFLIDFIFNGVTYNNTPIYFIVGQSDVLNQNVTGNQPAGGLSGACIASVTGEIVSIVGFSC